MGSMLDNSIKFVQGVGEVRAKLLEKELGVVTMRDMLYHFPFRYIDRSRIYKVREVTEDNASAYIQLRVRVVGKAFAGEGRKQRFSVYAADDTGRVELIWFKGIKWIEKIIEPNREYVVFGRPSFFRGEFSMVHPEIEVVEKALSRKVESGLQGIYSTTEKLSTALGTKGLYNIVCSLWGVVRGHIGEYLPEYIVRKYGLMPLSEALYNIHFPQSPENGIVCYYTAYVGSFIFLYGESRNNSSVGRDTYLHGNGLLGGVVVFVPLYTESIAVCDDDIITAIGN